MTTCKEQYSQKYGRYFHTETFLKVIGEHYFMTPKINCIIYMYICIHICMWMCLTCLQIEKKETKWSHATLVILLPPRYLRLTKIQMPELGNLLFRQWSKRRPPLSDTGHCCSPCFLPRTWMKDPIARDSPQSWNKTWRKRAGTDLETSLRTDTHSTFRFPTQGRAAIGSSTML